MTTSVEWWGLDDVIKVVDRFADRKLYERLMKEIVDDCADLMRNFAPVDRGLLEEAITVVKIDATRYAIIVDVPYAIFMEWGTKYFPVGTPESPRVRASKSGKTAYHPFMRLAVYVIDAEFEKYFKRILLYKG